MKNAEQWWTEECAYISRVVDDIVRDGRVPDAFNGDRACFIRYCEMQRNSAMRDGFYDAAQYIQHCLDDVGDRS